MQKYFLPNKALEAFAGLESLGMDIFWGTTTKPTTYVSAIDLVAGTRIR
jgi:hypothetical protein